jgi:hypothetical protein
MGEYGPKDHSSELHQDAGVGEFHPWCNGVLYGAKPMALDNLIAEEKQLPRKARILVLHGKTFLTTQLFGHRKFL